MKRPLALSALLLVALAVAPAVAAPQDTATAEARARFNEGVVLADAGDHEAARLKFNQAWALLKNPAVLYNLARAEQLSGHPIEALEHYRLFGKMASDPKIEEKQKQRAADNLAELSKKLGQIDVEGAPPGSRVSVDGKAVDTSGGDPVVVLPGKHVVEVVIDGKVKSVTVDASPGTVTKARFEQGKTEPPPPTAAPAEPAPPVVSDPGPSFWTTGRIVGAGAVVAGIAGIGVGVGFHLSAASASDEAAAIRATLPEPRDSACADVSSDACRSLKSSVDDRRAAEAIRNVGFAAGGALVVGGAILFLVSRPKTEPARGRLNVLPAIGARQATITLAGAF